MNAPLVPGPKADPNVHGTTHGAVCHYCETIIVKAIVSTRPVRRAWHHAVNSSDLCPHRRGERARAKKNTGFEIATCGYCSQAIVKKVHEYTGWVHAANGGWAECE